MTAPSTAVARHQPTALALLQAAATIYAVRIVSFNDDEKRAQEKAADEALALLAEIDERMPIGVQEVIGVPDAAPNLGRDYCPARSPDRVLVCELEHSHEGDHKAYVGQNYEVAWPATESTTTSVQPHAEA